MGRPTLSLPPPFGPRNFQRASVKGALMGTWVAVRALSPVSTAAY